MRKRVTNRVHEEVPRHEGDWLNLEALAEVEVTSEDAAHPIEAALLPGEGLGWRAGCPGKQVIRICFAHPRHIHYIGLEFVEALAERTQEYVLRWSPDGRSFQEIVRQQWNFSPGGATVEREHHRVDLSGVSALELSITPDIGDQGAVASLARLRIA